LTLGVAITVALVSVLGAFFASSESQMTLRAVRGVPVDWQVQLAPGTNAARTRATIDRTSGAALSAVVGYGDLAHLRSRVRGAVQTTGAGKALGIPKGYSSRFRGEIRYLVGKRHGVLLAQQGAANLHATVGSHVTLLRPGAAPVRVRVDGVIDFPQADSLFQAVGLPSTAAPVAPPDNVVVLPMARWQHLFGPQAHLDSGSSHLQVHLKLGGTLPPDPGAAFADVQGRANHLEAVLAGEGVVGDNLAAQLDAARADAVYAELLFLFLGLPGGAVAIAIVGVAASSGRDRRRKEQALLRLRGASPRQVVATAAWEAATIAILGCVAGIAGALVVARLMFSTDSLGGSTGQTFVWGAAAVLVGLVTSVVVIVLPTARDAKRLTVSGAQKTYVGTPEPLWARAYLDVILLAAAGLVYWKAVRSGYQVVLAPEGVPTISVDYFTLLAPLLLWTGAGFFIWRIGRAILTRGRGAIAAATRPLSGPLAGVVAASMGRQHRLLARGLVILALTTTFAISTSVFNSTFQAQSVVDAQLTNGSDVTVTSSAAAGLPKSLPARVKALPGVVAAEPMQHRYAYVGNDLQDLYGINPGTISDAAPISDAFFSGGSAQAVLSQLADRPDAVLVSDETVHDFQLHLGDLIRLRLQFAGDHAYHIVPFHYVGVVREFPTAPKDSFIIANAAYVASRTGSGAFQTLLTKTDGSPPAVATRISALLGAASGATVQDIQHQLHLTLSGLPAIDLSGLTKIELSFALLLAACGSGLILVLGLAERSRTFAILAALGAKQRQVGSFVWSEATFLTVGGLIFGSLAGWAIASMLVKILTGVFDPPPGHLFVPWTYLISIAVVGALAIAFGGSAMIRRTRRPVGKILRDL
jgi:putative ABC transport system permease protein